MQWLMDRLDEFIKITEPRNLSGNGFITTRSGPRVGRSVVMEKIDAIEQILDRHYPEWRRRRREWESTNYEFEDIRAAAIRCRARLHDAAELAQYLEPTGPSLHTDRLHPWVWEAAKSLWADGHHADAVAAAAEQLDHHLCAKIDNRRRKGSKLFQSVYSENAPKPDEPRLRPPSAVDPASDTWSSLLHGARHFGMGASLLVRNIATHERQMMNEYECLEALASLSLLARRVEADQVITDDGAYEA